MYLKFKEEGYKPWHDKGHKQDEENGNGLVQMVIIQLPPNLWKEHWQTETKPGEAITTTVDLSNPDPLGTIPMCPV